MLETIRDLISSNGAGPDGEAPTPEAVREAISETEAELERARERLDELNERHGKVLLHGTDEALDDHERKIELTEREIARLETAREELDAKLEEAKEAQETRRAIARAEEAMELKREGGDLVEEYRRLSARMVEVCERLEEIDQEVERRQDAFKESPEHEWGDHRSPGLELADAGKTPAYERAEIPAAEPDGPHWNARGWRTPTAMKRPNAGQSSSSQRPAGVYHRKTGERIDGERSVTRRGTVSEGI